MSGTAQQGWDATSVVRHLARSAGLSPMGLLPRLLAGMRQRRPRVVTTVPSASPLFAAAGIASRDLLEFAPRWAGELLPQNGRLQWLPCSADGGKVMMLGRRNADLAWPPSWRIGFSSVIAGKVRTVDVLAPPDVGAVALADGAFVPEVLAGASAALKKARPLVLVDLSSLDQRTLADTARAIRDVLAPDYVLLDSLLLPSNADAQLEEATAQGELWFVAVPGQRLRADRLLQILGSAEPAMPGAHWSEALADLLRRESRGGGIVGGQQLATRTRLLADEKLRCSGFWDTERAGTECWRWLGPAPEAALCFPRPFWGPGKIALRINGTSSDANLSGLRLFVDGELCPCSVSGEKGHWTLAARYTSARNRRQSMMVLRLLVPETRQVVPEDPRRLGISLAECSVHP